MPCSGSRFLPGSTISVRLRPASSEERFLPIALEAAGFHIKPDAEDRGHSIISALAIRDILESEFHAPQPLAVAVSTALGGSPRDIPALWSYSGLRR